ncbi:hypothetical protein L208DRAFT_1255612 [Tricholoma matsutake]|nr:hypothetical protein L208DRAFT_1255612 [Tricholoma matsutake 945]
MLGTPTPTQDSPGCLNCLIAGKSIVFPVTMKHHWVAGELKEDIQRKQELGTLKDVDPHTLELWKPKDSYPIAAKPADTLAGHIGLLEDGLSKFANVLDSTENIFMIFPKQPPSEYIHIIMKVQPTGE